MSVKLMSNLATRTLLVLIFLACGSQAQAIGTACIMPACPTGCDESSGGFQAPDNNIRRTFLIQKKISFDQSHSRNSTQQLPISIDEQDLFDMLGPGSRSVHWESGDSLNISIDVGLASTDTQFWSFPAIDFFEGVNSLSLDPALAPYADSFSGSNVIYRSYSASNQDTNYVYYKLDSLELLKLGHGIDDGSTFALLDYFETDAFLPIEAGWEIDETITTLWSVNTVVDSLVQHKLLSVDATGMLTPFGEDPVPAVLTFAEYESLAYKDGAVFSSLTYDAFIWFSVEGHRIYGILEDGAPVEGVTQFSKIIYQRYIKPCGNDLDLGIDPLQGVYKAQDELVSSAKLANSSIQFVAGNGIELKAGFSTDGDFEAVTDADPCNY